MKPWLAVACMVKVGQAALILSRCDVHSKLFCLHFPQINPLSFIQFLTNVNLISRARVVPILPNRCVTALTLLTLRVVTKKRVITLTLSRIPLLQHVHVEDPILLFAVVHLHMVVNLIHTLFDRVWTLPFCLWTTVAALEPDPQAQ